MIDEDDHHQKTVQLLITLGLLVDGEELEPPYNKASGVQGVSAIYFYKLPRGRLLVVKFDRKDRMVREKTVLKILNGEQCGSNCLLNVGGVNDLKHMQDAIVYQAASGPGLIKTLDQFLKKDLGKRSQHGRTALGKVFDTLTQLHKSTSSAHGSHFKWKDLFKKVNQHEEDIRKVAGQHGLDLDELPASLGQETGTLPLGRIHGDLNLTNAIIAIDTDLMPSYAYLIDFADSLPNRPLILDAIRLETELWQETAPALVKEEEESDFLESFKAARKQLDSFSIGGQPSNNPLIQDLFELTQLIRNWANLPNPLSQQQYLIGLGLTHLHATTFDTVKARPLKMKLALHGAALCQIALRQTSWQTQPPKSSSTTAKTGSDTPFRQSVLEKITDLLKQPHMTSCRGALMSCLNRNFPAQEITSKAPDIAQALCDRDLDQTITWLGIEVKNLNKDSSLEAEHSVSLWETAAQILGWLVLLGVDEEWAEKQDPSMLIKGNFHIPAKTADGAAIAIQRIHKKPGSRLPPETGPTRGWTLEAGLEIDDGVKKVKQLIWNHFLPHEPAPSFETPDDDEELDCLFFSRAAGNDPGLVIDLSDGLHPINCPGIQEELNKLRNFHVIYFNAGEKTSIVLSERRLVRAVHEFLRRRDGKD